MYRRRGPSRADLAWQSELPLRVRSVSACAWPLLCWQTPTSRDGRAHRRHGRQRPDFWETMRTQTRRGRTVLSATHYLEEAASFADRIVIIAHGRLVADRSRSGPRGDGALVTATWPGLEESLGQRLATVPRPVSGIQARGHPR